MFKTFTGTGTHEMTSVSPVQGTQAWHPTVLYMLALVIAEIIAVGFLSRHLLKG